MARYAIYDGDPDVITPSGSTLPQRNSSYVNFSHFLTISSNN